MDIVVHMFFYLFLCPSTRRCGKEILGGSYWLLLAGEGQVASPFAGHRLMISSIDRGKINLLPRKLTWNLKMMVSERNLLFQGLLFRFHVKFQGCIKFLCLASVFGPIFQGHKMDGAMFAVKL